MGSWLIGTFRAIGTERLTLFVAPRPDLSHGTLHMAGLPMIPRCHAEMLTDDFTLCPSSRLLQSRDSPGIYPCPMVKACVAPWPVGVGGGVGGSLRSRRMRNRIIATIGWDWKLL